MLLGSMDFPGGSGGEPAMQETLVRSLGWEDPLEKGTAPHSSMPGEVHGQRSLVGYSHGVARESDTT